MVLKLYGYPQSSYTRLVALVCKEKRIPYEFVKIDLVKGEQKAPKYVESHPFGQVPYIDDDGFILYESRAICRYLIKKYPNQGTALIPTDPKEEALFEQAASVEASHFSAAIGPLVKETIVKGRFGLKPDQAKVDEHVKNVETKFDVYETILSKQKYITGDTLTLADLQHVAYASMLPLAVPTFAIGRWPNVARWTNELMSRPTWQAVKDGP